MKEIIKDNKIKVPIRIKLLSLVVVCMGPLLCITIYLVFSLLSYSRAYDQIVDRITIANNYSLDFKERMDESLYKLAVGYMTFDTIDEDPALDNPYTLIDEARVEAKNLYQVTTDSDSILWLQSFTRNLDTLEDRVNDIRKNIEKGGKYDVNMKMLDTNIYILTELIQDDIQYYIYYQTQGIERLKVELNRKVSSYIFFMTVLLSVIVLVVIAVTTRILFGITNPIKSLMAATQKISKGDFSVHTDVRSQDELGNLADSINDMAGKLETYVTQIKEDERRWRHAELRLLQEQINPHFLYNTLDTIVWLIEGNDPDKAVEMVVSLSDFFRLVLSKGKEYISIRDEESHISSYLKIQQVRYRDILEYEIKIDPALYEYKILKLTLQPLVENSLYHGIKYKRAKGNIIITGELKEDIIHFRVEDNGVGMNEEDLSRLQKEITKPCKDTEVGFGLANVNERIRMNFGPQYGISIQSKQGLGTSVDIIMPAILMNDVSEAISSPDTKTEVVNA